MWYILLRLVLWQNGPTHIPEPLGALVVSRLRIDLLLNLEWKVLLPINLANIVIMVITVLAGWTLTDLFPTCSGWLNNVMK